MKKSLKSEEIQKYFRNWRTDFNYALMSIITNQIGYTRIRNASFIKSRHVSSEQMKDDLKKRKKDLTKFGKSFSSLYEKLDSSPISLRNIRVSSKKLSKGAAELKTVIVQQINELEKEITVRYRKRIPTELAFELIRALHFSSGNRDALNILKELIENPNQLQKDVDKAVLQVKAELLSWIAGQKSAHFILMKRAKTKRRRMNIAVEIRQLDEAKKRMLAYKNKFSPIGTNRGNDPQWATRLKEHLIRSILSDGEQRIIKNLSIVALRRKMLLIKKVDKKNSETMKR